MKKFPLLLLLATLYIHVTAQVSEGGLPPSYKSEAVKNSATMASINLPGHDQATPEATDAGNQLPFRYAVLHDVSIDIKKSGTKTVLPEGGTIWQFRINSPDARSLQVLFRKYLVPAGARLFLYNQDYAGIRGAYTDYNITEGLSFVTGDFPGNHVIIEYYEPADAKFAGEVVIGQVGRAYVDILMPKSGNTDNDGFIPVNCIEGKSVQDQKHAVCKYTFNDGQYSYLCSGALITTVDNSVRTYFLTAAHCISTPGEAATMVAYFNYEEAACSAALVNPSQTLSGASLLSTGSESDYSLLKFDRSVPFTYKAYFAGWDVTDSPPENSVCMHHPGGKTKKISIDYDPAGINTEDISWEGGSTSPRGTHWAVGFDEGTTSSGSSGSPLFDKNRRITGQLHGGSETDYFGKLSYSWQHPDSQYPSLQSFLDPELTGVKTADGYYPPGNTPDPQFDSPFSTVCTNAPIELSGYSAFSPSEWNWSFIPDDVTYHDGTEASSQTPKVSFPTEGNYRVTLKVTNNAGQDELTLDNYINAGSALSLKTISLSETDSCIVTFTGLTLEALGADAWLWKLSDNSDDLFYIENNTANPVVIRVIDGIAITSATVLEISLTGIQGTCQNILPINIPLRAQTNDFAKKAIPLKPGTSGPFSNVCASIEDGEPVPPYTDCTGQLSWCNEYGNGKKIVERSVWFSYTPEVNQTISLSSSGFDNQIAIYSANSVSALLAGNYTLLAANDDFTETDPNPFITSVDLKASQKYWIQVDGSGGGLTGTFNLNLSVLSSVGETVYGDKINVYPQPALDFVNIESSVLTRCSVVRTELVDSAGRTVFSDDLAPDGGRIQLPTGSLAPGIYLARLYCDGEVTVVKVVK